MRIVSSVVFKVQIKTIKRIFLKITTTFLSFTFIFLLHIFFTNNCYKQMNFRNNIIGIWKQLKVSIRFGFDVPSDSIAANSTLYDVALCNLYIQILQNGLKSLNNLEI